MSKKVLIITYFFPPRKSIAARRLYGFAKYIKQFGWEPIILTPKIPDRIDNEYRVIEVDYSGDLEELISFAFSPKDAENKLLKDIFEYPDKFRNWEKRAVKKAVEFLEKEKVDAIISSSGPETTHLIANYLKKRYNLPWLADMRDLWTLNHTYKRSLIRKMIDTKLEKNILKKTDAISVVSEPYAKVQSNFLDGKKVYSIQNGFDPIDLVNSKDIYSDKMTFVYTGMIYEENQNIEHLFEAMKALSDEKKIDKNNIEIKFYGSMPDNLHKKAEKYNLENTVHFGGNIPREEAVEVQRNSQILLYFQFENFEHRGVYCAKIYEYLAAKRPILGMGGQKDVVAELLEQTKAGVHVIDKAELKKVLVEYYTEFIETGKVSYHGISEEINKYSYVEMARKFADILNEISGEKTNV
jgi:glycosyltransferase involved in cell wall biosynthesis